MTERLYPLAPTTAVDAAEGHFEPCDDGGFDFPGPLAAQQHAARVGGRKLWETAIERQERTHADDLARRRDPAALYDAVGSVTDAFRQIGAVIGNGAPADAAAEIAALRQRIAELEGAASDSADAGQDAAGDAVSAAKPAVKRKPAAARTAAPAE